MRKPAKKLIEPSPVAVAKRKERQIDVASGTLQVIARDGLEGASMRAIAHELGCSTGALTHYFRDKESLIQFTLDTISEAVSKAMAEVVSARGGLDGFIDAIGRLLSFDETHAVYWRAWFVITAASQTQESFRSTHARRLARMRRTLAGRLKELQTSGDANPDLDPEEEAASLTSFIDGLGLHALISPEAFTTARRRSLLEGFCSRWHPNAKKRPAR
jgi:AcrR family transcriptional regulator